MSNSRLPDDPRLVEALALLGAAVRRARRDNGLSQERLEGITGIDQSTISRLERGLAPNAPIHRLVWLGVVLGRSLPLGTCPHDHACAWPPLCRTRDARRSGDDEDHLDGLIEAEVHDAMT